MCNSSQAAFYFLFLFFFSRLLFNLEGLASVLLFSSLRRVHIALTF